MFSILVTSLNDIDIAMRSLTRIAVRPLRVKQTGAVSVGN